MCSNAFSKAKIMYIDTDNLQYFSIHHITPEDALLIASCLNDCSSNRIAKLGKKLIIEVEKSIAESRIKIPVS
jgi:hypothetical protein